MRRLRGRIAKRAKGGPRARRLLALATIHGGGARSEAAKIGDVTLQIVLDWVFRLNAHGPEGLLDRKAPGQPSLLKDEHRAALARIVEDGPTPAIHGVVRWRIVDLCQWLFEEFRISVSETTMSREPRAVSYRKLSARASWFVSAVNASVHSSAAISRGLNTSVSRRTPTRSSFWIGTPSLRAILR
jgi:transposase